MISTPLKPTAEPDSILRTDLGFPLRTAYLVNDSNWVRKSKDIVGGTVFNLAIGYPF